MHDYQIRDLTRKIALFSELTAPFWVNLVVELYFSELGRTREFGTVLASSAAGSSLWCLACGNGKKDKVLRYHISRLPFSSLFLSSHLLFPFTTPIAPSPSSLFFLCDLALFLYDCDLPLFLPYRNLVLNLTMITQPLLLFFAIYPLFLTVSPWT